MVGKKLEDPHSKYQTYQIRTSPANTVQLSRQSFGPRLDLLACLRLPRLSAISSPVCDFLACLRLPPCLRRLARIERGRRADVGGFTTAHPWRDVAHQRQTSRPYERRLNDGGLRRLRSSASE
jgi:hypothetical protein